MKFLLLKLSIFILFLFQYTQSNSQDIIRGILNYYDELNEYSGVHNLNYGIDTILFPTSMIRQYKIKRYTKICQSPINNKSKIIELSEYSTKGLLTTYCRFGEKIKIKPIKINIKYDSSNNPIEISEYIANKLFRKISESTKRTDSGLLKTTTIDYRKFKNIYTIHIKDSANVKKVFQEETGIGFYKVMTDSGYIIYPFELGYDSSSNYRLIFYEKFNQDSTIKFLKNTGIRQLFIEGLILRLSGEQHFNKKNILIKQIIGDDYLVLYNEKGRPIELREKESESDNNYRILHYNTYYEENSILPYRKKYYNKDCKFYYEYY